MTTTSTKTIGKHVFTLVVDEDNLIAKITRPAKSRLWIAYILNCRYRSKADMDRSILSYITALETREQRVAEYKAQRKAEGRDQTAAQAIKKELVKAFPSVKFSCRYETFSGGDSVDVCWTDWPTSEDVEKYTRKYQYGHFNWMEDIYEYTNSRDDIPQAKWVSCRRDVSPENRKFVEDYVEKTRGTNERITDDVNTLAYRIYNKQPIYGKVVAVNPILRDSWEGYSWIDGYTLECVQ